MANVAMKEKRATGGYIRALRHALALPLRYGLDDRDYQLFSRREIRAMAWSGWFAMMAAYLPWVTGGYRRWGD